MLRVFRTNDPDFVQCVHDIMVSQGYGQYAIENVLLDMKAKPNTHVIIFTDGHSTHITGSQSRKGLIAQVKLLKKHGYTICAISFPGERASYRHWLEDFTQSGAIASAIKLAMFLI